MKPSMGTVTRIEPALGAAIDRVVDLSQRVVIDRIELLQVESKDWLVRAARSAGLASLGTLSLAVAWIALLAAAVVALDGRMPLGVRLVLVAAVQVVVGGSLLGWAMLRRRGAR
jgi:hypothetical protein